MGRLKLAFVLGVLVVVFGAGWAAATAFQSPEQRQASQRPPEPRPILEPVRAGSLKDTVSARADIVARQRYELSPGELPDRSVVTSMLVHVGDTVDAGAFVGTVQGRPVFVLPGDFTLYRDLERGATGPDVDAVQRGLAAAGHPIPDSEKGRFGWYTERALTTLYEGAGFAAALRPQDAEPPSVAPTETEVASETDSAESPGVGSTATTSPPAQPVMTVYLPLAEVIMAPRLPARVVRVPAVGDLVAGSVGSPGENSGGMVTLAAGGLVAKAPLAPSAVARLAEGTPVTLVPESGQRRHGKVSAIEPIEANAGESSGEQAVLVTPDQALPDDWAGTNVLAEMMIDVVVEDALIVPTRAVAARPDGTTYVHKMGKDGFVPIDVDEIGTLGGQSAIRPVEPGTLVEGDDVRVG